jgi:hypothetical protein
MVLDIIKSESLIFY